jgi:cyclase
MSLSPALPTSKHFQLEPLTDGIYAAIAKEGSVARANAGIVDLGDRVLIFDTFMAPQAARDLVRIAQEITGHPVGWVANSHWHSDHVLGNQVMPQDAILISTHLTRDLIAERIPPRIEEQRGAVPQALRDLEARLQTKLDTQERLQVGETIDFYRMALEDLPTLSVRLPVLTFENRLVLHGPARTAELITFGGGHTASDVILYLPVAQIAFVADLLFNGSHPWLGDGDPDAWLRILDTIEAISPAVEVVVPGHGSIGTPANFAAIRRYIPATRKLAEDLLARGGTADDAAALTIPAAFSSWPGEATFASNMRFWHAKLSAEV